MRPSRARRGCLTVAFTNGVVARVESGVWTTDDRDPAIAALLDSLTWQVADETLTYIPSWTWRWPSRPRSYSAGASSTSESRGPRHPGTTR
jgi:hypothetical protein